MKKHNSMWLVAVLMVFALTCDVRAVTLDADQELALTWNSFTNIAGTDDTVVVKVTVITTNYTWSLFYDWADKNGNDTGVAATSGLNLGSHRVYADKGKYVYNYPTTEDGGRRNHVILNLNGGSISGTVDSVQLSTTTATTGDNDPAGSLTITNVADMSLGQITTGGNPGYAGALTIGEPDQPAGNIRVSGIVASASHRGAGKISIYGSGDVLIQTISGTATNIDSATRDSYPGGKNSVTIHHDGAFVAHDILAWGRGNARYNMEFSGDSLSNGVTGVFEARHVDNSGYYGGSIGISGYTDVTISGNVKTRATLPSAGSLTITNIPGSVTIDGSVDLSTQGMAGSFQRGGNVEVWAGGDITIGGELDLNSADGGNAYDGNLDLRSANGKITISSLVLTSVGRAAFEAKGNTTVMGMVSDFATNSISGEGTLKSPYVTTQSELRVPVTEKIIYYWDLSENAYLGRATYKIADPNGVPGAGGVLTPFVPSGTVIVVK